MIPTSYPGTRMSIYHQAMQQWMTDHGGTPADLARALGVTPKAVRAWLADDAIRIRDSHRKRIAEVCRAYLPAGTVAASPQPKSTRFASGGATTIANTEELRFAIMTAMVGRGETVEQFCRRIGYDHPATLHRLYKGELATWFPSVLSKVAAALDLSFDELPITAAERALLSPVFADAELVRDIPVISLAAAATAAVVNGQVHFEENVEDAVETVRIPTQGRHYAAVRAEGHSMFPVLHAGQIAILDNARQPANGNMVVAKLRDDGVVIKWYHREGDTIYLHSEAPDGQNFAIPAAQVEWCYPVAYTQQPSPTTRRLPPKE